MYSYFNLRPKDTPAEYPTGGKFAEFIQHDFIVPTPRIPTRDHEDFKQTRGTKQRRKEVETMTALDTFDMTRITVSSTHPPGDVELFVRTRGSGEGLLLLHGYPQTGRYVLFSSPPYIVLVSPRIRLRPSFFPAYMCEALQSGKIRLILRMWHKIANQLAEKYTVVIPDLRGMSSPSVKCPRFWKGQISRR
jgi:hypothetical protein